MNKHHRRNGPWHRVVAILAALSTLVLSGVPALADFEPAGWPSLKPVLLPPQLEREGLVEVVLDQEVFAGALSGLGDLRVVEVATGREVPYKLLIERGERRRRSVAAQVRDLASAPGRETSFVAEVGEVGALHNEIEVLTSSKNFRREAVVEGSTDGTTWLVLQKGQRIFDFTEESRGFSQRLTRIQYPESTARYLRVRILDAGEEPLVITGATVSLIREIPAQEVSYPATLVAREEREGGRRSILVFDLGVSRLPIHRLALTIPQVNFFRKALLEGSDDQQLWTTLVSSAELYAYDTPKFVGANRGLDYAERAFRYLRLTINNEDNPPLPVTGAEASAYQRRLIFSAQPGASYNLYYGKGDARAPSYELERVFPYLVTEGLPRAGLGPQAGNPQYAVKEPVVPFTERYPWLLPSVIAAAALGIGFFLSRVFRAVRQLLPPPP